MAEVIKIQRIFITCSAVYGLGIRVRITGTDRWSNSQTAGFWGFWIQEYLKPSQRALGRLHERGSGLYRLVEDELICQCSRHLQTLDIDVRRGSLNLKKLYNIVPENPNLGIRVVQLLGNPLEYAFRELGVMDDQIP